MHHPSVKCTRRAGEVEYKHMEAVFNHHLLSQSHYSPLAFLTAVSVTVTHDENSSANKEENGYC